MWPSTPAERRHLAFLSVPHMLPSTIMNVSASANLMDFEAQSHTPLDHCVRFAAAVAGDYATLATGPRATTLPGPVFHRQERASFS
jgi:hypothetical protein